MRDFQPQNYGPVFAALVDGDRYRPLDAGRPDKAVRGRLEVATVAEAFAHADVVDPDMARCCLAGAWLVHDFLDESHHVSQSVDTPTGAFWHGVMHRREGDFSNAKYWFARIGKHEALASIGARVQALADGSPLARVIAPDGQYDPRAMVDACQKALRTGDGKPFCRAVQQVEWEELFDYCYRRAIS